MMDYAVNWQTEAVQRRRQMKADREAFAGRISILDRNALLALALSLYDEMEEMRLKHLENERISTEAHIQFSELNAKYTAAIAENENLKKLLQKEIEKNTLKTRSTFGRKTEGFLSMVDAADNPEEEPVDESDSEDMKDPGEHKKRIIAFPGNSGKKTPGKKAEERSGGKSLARSLDRLPQQLIYELDMDKLNEQYGEGCWRIAYWHSHRTLMKLDTPYYTQVTYTPVVSVGLEHDLFTCQYMNPLLDKSFVSYTIIADILYRKFVLGLPFYRQSRDYMMQEIAITKQTLIHWVNTLVPEICSEVYEYMMQLLISCRYIQSDETFIQVNKDGYGPGHKSYMWVHTVSELLDCPPVIVFCYELTRGTDHLRECFQEFLGYITCDAYISYQTLEDESDGRIRTSGCMMHCRRYFAEAFFVRNVAELSDEDLKELPETKALLLIREIYQEENALKDMTTEERLTVRKELVAPKIDAFFSYIHSLESADDIFSDRMKKAIQYAVNQESRLRLFLTDGNIPCDNGFCERIIRSYSIGRANWLFADTIDGAKVNAIMYSIVETAKANHANVQYYLQYLFEQIPLRRAGGDTGFMAEMMPWSDAYREYERCKRKQQQSLFGQLFPRPDRPRAPLKKNVTTTREIVPESAGGGKEESA